MDESSYSNLATSHLLGSVPAVINEEKKASYEVPEANMQNFPPNSGSGGVGGGGGGGGYQTLVAPTEGFEQQPPNNWKGVFSISSYTQYFNVDTDVVINRLISSFYPVGGDFFDKIDANPDLYGFIWITTTLVFMLASFGNCATYLMQKRTDGTTSWSFDVGYVNAAACGIYGYTAVVPLAFYFLLRYLGSNASLVRFWCMWGYSLSIFIPTAFLLLIPVEILRWIIILIAGTASACFVALNLRSYIEGANDLTMMVVAAFLLQMALAIFIKVWFFP
ncbi:protein YIPF1 homolog isoform X2 [Durio zibethinus]|uniref:Protein YIP n=1 Tax=Durio zibethinus TaxID=66656 RepID=A0A6P6AJQ8_DURZI|nr:protein YIPF1 homolog isoform X2 [Durio zibethinus]